MKSAGSALGWALTMASALLAFNTAASAQLSVDELEVTLRPDVPAQRTGVIRITNDTDKPVQAMLEIQDWNRDMNGANQFSALGTVSGSCKEHLKVFPMSVRIEAHRTEPVRVSYDGDAAASCWGIVFMQSNEPPKSSAGQSQITYVVRTGVKVYVESQKARREGDVDSVKLTMANKSESDTTQVKAIAVVFRNTGAAHLKPTGAVEVRSANNDVVAKLNIPEFPIAPGDGRRIVLALPALAPGRYVALALIDYGGLDISAGQLEFEVK